MNSIVFVNPPLSTSDRYGIKFQSGGQTPPLGLANLAAMCRKYGFNTAIIDAPALNVTHEEVVKNIIDNRFHLVGITPATISIGHAAILAGLIKKADKTIKVIIGGPHLTALPAETMSRYPCFDIGVIGEADYTIIDLLHALKKGDDIARVKGLIIRVSGGLFVTEARPFIKNLDELPKPAWDLLPNLAKHYCPPVHTLKRIPAGLLVASRGCPGRCSFCDRSVFGNVTRTHSAQYTFELIEELYFKYGLREIQFRDDNFVAFPKRMIELCRLLKDRRLDLVWTCAGRVDMVTPEVLKMMKDAGCWQIWYGVESGSQKVLDCIQKNTTIQQIREVVHMTFREGISPCGFFMIGSPGETKETMAETVNFALELPLGEAHFSFCTPFPGSDLYKHSEKYGIFENDWAKLNGWNPVFVAHGLALEDLQHYSKMAFRKFYFRPRIMLSYLKRIRSLKHLKIYFSGFAALLQWLFISKLENRTRKPVSRGLTHSSD